jgi:hypothetical protein
VINEPTPAASTSYKYAIKVVSDLVDVTVAVRRGLPTTVVGWLYTGPFHTPPGMTAGMKTPVGSLK